MIKCTNFLRKYVTIMPLFYEKTHFFKKKSRKTALKGSRRLNSNDARNALPQPAPCSTAYTQARKTEGKKLHQTKN